MLLGFGGAATSAVSEGPQPIHTAMASGDEVTAGAGASPGERFRRTELTGDRSKWSDMPGNEQGSDQDVHARLLRAVIPAARPSPRSIVRTSPAAGDLGLAMSLNNH
ncbi:MAG: hypothetical protein ACRDRK_03045 [Pseudonocardia sp.]